MILHVHLQIFGSYTSPTFFSQYCRLAFSRSRYFVWREQQWLLLAWVTDLLTTLKVANLLVDCPRKRRERDFQEDVIRCPETILLNEGHTFYLRRKLQLTETEIVWNPSHSICSGHDLNENDSPWRSTPPLWPKQSKICLATRHGWCHFSLQHNFASEDKYAA